MLMLLLAGCAGHRVRPDAPPAVKGGTPPVADALPGAPGPVDDTSLPQSSRYQDADDGGPVKPPSYIATLTEPTPVPEARSRYGNKSPYVVRGKTYRVLRSAKGYDERGIASWYGNKFHGYMTSNFEKYDMYKFSAASKVLPLPTWARVTNLENGKSVIVRVNDRGPFVDNRIIDLSYAAAVRIGIWPKGTGLVEVQAIDPAHPQELPKPGVVESAGSHPGIWLQVGAFGDPDNAERVARRLRAAGLGPVQVTRLNVQGRDVRRVRLGPLKSVSAADRMTRRVTALGLPTPQVAVD
ncbi:septal ring lytic transglycosylase RlpA family protein [Oleiagrimonas soli]|nr:septal ring lytic transglycosylase RlpA family protein [Oleiagrimonas soli]MBB6184388.1 rare lipoprotein A [Oleiagrimonas soli]